MVQSFLTSLARVAYVRIVDNGTGLLRVFFFASLFLSQLTKLTKPPLRLGRNVHVDHIPVNASRHFIFRQGGREIALFAEE